MSQISSLQPCTRDVESPIELVTVDELRETMSRRGVERSGSSDVMQRWVPDLLSQGFRTCILETYTEAAIVHSDR